MTRIGLSLALLLLAAGCRVAEPVDVCVNEPGRCPDCADSSECVFAGNSCQKHVYCIHRDTEFAVTDEGCSQAVQYEWPSDSDCACRDAVCRTR